LKGFYQIGSSRGIWKPEVARFVGANRVSEAEPVVKAPVDGLDRKPLRPRSGPDISED
jgi:hypothetical protein